MRTITILSLLLLAINHLNAQETDTIVDPRDGQVYNIVKIGDQWWMAENLKATYYADGTPIPKVTDNFAWSSLGSTNKAYCWYDNDSIVNSATYGALYTWAAAMNGEASSDANPSGLQGVCPDGWHLPSDAEWKELEMYLGMSQIDADDYGYRGTDEGGKMKETGLTHWTDPNTGATNSSGFTALPSGYRVSNGNVGGMGVWAYFWSSTGNSSTAWLRRLYYNDSGVNRDYVTKGYGISVRCLRDFAYLTFSSDTVDFGVIDKSIADTTQFIYLKNTDTSSFVIDSIVVVGPILAADLPDYPGLEDISIAAGDSTLLNITLSTVNFEGLFNDRIWFYSNHHFTSVFLKAEIPSEIIVMDYDGNTYNTQSIGDQIWMRENLKTTHYADGTSLVDGTGVGNITGNYTTRYYFWYNDDSATYAATLGALYTGAAAMNEEASSDANPSGLQGVCPDGWHLPSDAEWKELEMYLGMSKTEADGMYERGTDEGGKMKETGLTHWFNPNTGATNSSGFTALPAGGREDDGYFGDLGYYAYFWASDEEFSDYVWRRELESSTSVVYRSSFSKDYGFSVRCLRDVVLPSDTILTESNDQKVTLRWSSDRIGNLEMYKIFRDGNLIDSVEILGITDTVYVDSGLVYETNYEYYIISVDAFGNESQPSDTVSAIPSEIVEDYDGNTYSTVKIGDQIWIRENLETTHFADGTPLVDGTGAGNIQGDYTSKYYFWYGDDSVSYADTYGALYTWAAAMNGASSSEDNPSGVQGVCPDGWHLPSDS